MNFEQLLSLLFISCLFSYVVVLVFSQLTRIFHRLNGDERTPISFP